VDNDNEKLSKKAREIDPLESELMWSKMLNRLNGEYSQFAYAYRAPAGQESSEKVTKEKPTIAAAHNFPVSSEEH